MRNATCSPDVTIVTKTFWWSMVIQIKSIGSIATITRLTTMLKTVLMHDAPKNSSTRQDYSNAEFAPAVVLLVSSVG